ncbi:TetR/AcrR family transcriptional regulator [Pseudonocardia pini]|uniref:TetR/AcrR family transcriptional regulator n=1 Tax=Pseudonocardia pini TaxID=2758030 RepID=UPI0015F0AB13|nr:TetR/AcrR family transcriptional regulator [Pseudonocardia pini]
MAGGERRTRDPERRERILTEAATLIAHSGYLGVNLADIGAAAGIVGSGIYRHFDNKGSILVELFDRVVDRLVLDAEQSLRATDSAGATLAALVRGQVRFTIAERALCQVYLQEAHNLPEQDSRRLRWKQRHYVDLWQEALASLRGDLSPSQVQALVHAAISVVHSPLRYRNDLDDTAPAAFLEHVACTMLGVEPPAADPRTLVEDGSRTVAG